MRQYADRMTEGEPPHGAMKWPKIWLVSGLAGGAATALTAALSLFVLAGVFGALTSTIAIVLTFVIAYRQARESSALNATVTKIDDAVSELGEANERLYRLTLDIAEQASAQSYESAEDDAADDSAPDATGRPPYEVEALQRLQTIGSTITPATASWRQKVPDPPIRGNHGWFVESNDPASTERWYVRKGRYWNMRKAMPRELLDALETQREVNPRTIKLDFQLKEHGLASWYARTYGGDLWRVWKPNRNAELGVQTRLVTEDLEI